MVARARRTCRDPGGDRRYSAVPRPDGAAAAQMAERALVAICGRARLRQRAHSADGAVLGAPGPVVAGVARARQGSARAPPARVRGLDVVPRTISRSNAFRTHVLRSS